VNVPPPQVIAVKLWDTVGQGTLSHLLNHNEWLLVLHEKNKLIGKISLGLNFPLG
jgi:hypothetical protein